MNYRTNGHYRELKYLVRDENDDLVEFDNTIHSEDLESEPCFKYKGDYFSLNEFMRYEADPYDGCLGFSYFNVLYITLNESNDEVKVTYFWQ